MITRLCLRNYRAFESLDIPLRKMNIFVGPNNSGKSSLLSSLILLSQTLKSADEQVPLLISGPNQDLGTYKDLVFGNINRRPLRFYLSFNTRIPREDIYKDFSIDMTFKYRAQRREIILQNSRICNPLGNERLSSTYSKDTEKQIVKIDRQPIQPSKKREQVFIRRKNFLLMPSFVDHDVRDIRTISNLIFRELSEIEYIGPFRKEPLRTYLFSGESPTTIGSHGEKAVDLLVSDEMKRGKKRLGLVDYVSFWLRRFDIAKSLSINTLTDRHYEIRLQHIVTDEFENMADIGYGCSQILPVLVAVVLSGTSGKLIVEQPELHLHPRAQAELASFFVDTLGRDAQLLLETHSEHMIIRFQTHVAKGDISPEDIAFFYCQPTSEAGKTVKQLNLSKDGYFREAWPDGFFPEKLEESKKLAAASYISKSSKSENNE